MYVTKPGSDPSLTSIGISAGACPGDASSSQGRWRHSLTSAAAAGVLRRLQDEPLLCGVTLIGWEPAGGRDAWVSAARADKGHVTTTAHDLDPASVSFAAIIDVVVDEDDGEDEAAGGLRIVGSPVLVEQASRIAPPGAVFEARGTTVVRAPEVRIVGQDAERVACALVREYSKYIGALFDNFD